MKITRASKRRNYHPNRRMRMAEARWRRTSERLFRETMDAIEEAIFGMPGVMRTFAEAIRDDIQRFNHEVLTEVIGNVMRDILPPLGKRG